MMEQKSYVKKETNAKWIVLFALVACLVAFAVYKSSNSERLYFDDAARIAANDARFAFYEPADYQDSGEISVFRGSGAEYDGRPAYRVNFEDKDGNEYTYIIDSQNGEILQSGKSDISV